MVLLSVPFLHTEAAFFCEQLKPDFVTLALVSDSVGIESDRRVCEVCRDAIQACLNPEAESRFTAAMAFLEPIEVVESARGGTQSFMHPGTPRPHPTPCMGFASTRLQLKATSLDPKVNYSDFMDSVNRGDVEMVRVQAG